MVNFFITVMLREFNHVISKAEMRTIAAALRNVDEKADSARVCTEEMFEVNQSRVAGLHTVVANNDVLAEHVNDGVIISHRGGNVDVTKALRFHPTNRKLAPGDGVDDARTHSGGNNSPGRTQ